MMRITTLLIAACAGLAGCAGQKHIEVQRVNVPVPVPCQEPVPVRPVMPTDGLKPGTPLPTFVRAAQAEIERREGYEGELRTALDNCRRPLTPLVPD